MELMVGTVSTVNRVVVGEVGRCTLTEKQIVVVEELVVEPVAQAR